MTKQSFCDIRNIHKKVFDIRCNKDGCPVHGIFKIGLLYYRLPIRKLQRIQNTTARLIQQQNI